MRTRTPGALWPRRALVATALLLSVIPSPAPCSLIGPSVHGLAVSSTEVAVRVGPRVLFFDHSGAFRRDLILAELPLDRARLLTLTDDGHLWVAIAEEAAQGDAASTTLAAVDESGNIVRHQLTGNGMVYATPRGRLFAGRVEAQRLKVEHLEATGRLSPYADVGIEKALRILDLEVASAVSWAVDEGGEIYVLTTAAERGRVTRYRRSGEVVTTWEVAPDPVTSVAYLKEVILDRDGVPYVTHSSWEVSSSTSNAGSVIRLNPGGGESLRIKEGIGYLQHAGVSAAADVFVSDLSEKIYRFSSAGEPMLSWIAVPPQFGESWEERRQRIAEAGRVEPSSSPAELLSAVVYGEGEIGRKGADWLLARGPSTLPAVMAALSRFDQNYELQALAERIWKAYPAETVKMFEETRDEETRRILSPFLAYLDEPPAGVREVLSRMVLEGDEGARYALNHLGPTPEVVAARIAAFRRAQLPGEESSFDAEWDLRQGYPWSIGALEAILQSPDDPDRRAVRQLILQASLDLVKEDGASKSRKVRPIPEDVMARTRRWAEHPDPFVREAGAIALTSFAVPGQEAAVVAASRKSPELLLPSLKAFAVLAAAHPDLAAPHAETLSSLARSGRPPNTQEDPLAELAKIPHPLFVRLCLNSLADESLPPGRRGEILLGLDVAVVPPPALIALLNDWGWQRSLSREYFYYSFLDDIAKAYPAGSGVRVAAKNALLAIVLDGQLDLKVHDPEKDIDALAKALASLRPLMEASDLPRLLPLLDSPGLERSARSQVLWVLSRVPPNRELSERLIPLLDDPDLALVAAQSLGRVGHPAALEVLVERGLKRLGYYSEVDLEIESLRPLGRKAELALLGLLDYPNSGTRSLVRRYLVEFPSAEGLRRIKNELAAAIESGRAPEAYTLEALALAGVDLVEPLLKLVAATPEVLETLPRAATDGPLTDQLRRALAKEVDPRRHRLLNTLVQQVCYCDDE